MRSSGLSFAGADMHHSWDGEYAYVGPYVSAPRSPDPGPRGFSPKSSMGLPTRSGLSAGLVEMNFHSDMNDPPERNVVTLAADVVLCQFHFTVAFHMIDDADVNAVGAENFQIFRDQRRGDHEFLHGARGTLDWL